MSAIVLTVVSKRSIGKALNRIVFSAPDLLPEQIPEQHQGLHIKLFFKQAGQANLLLPRRDENNKIVWPPEDQKPLARTYSIQDFDAETQLLTIDFVLHQEYGIAGDFAQYAKLGDTIGFAGPGPALMIDRQAEHLLLVGDLSALPAISSVVNSLPFSKAVKVIVELEEENIKPVLMEEYFSHSPHDICFIKQDFSEKSMLLNEVKKANVEQSQDRWSIALAGEHQSVVTIRKYLRSIDFNKRRLYAVPYWRHQHNEEKYHAQRHEVMDE